jgi:hypothetical protein
MAKNIFTAGEDLSKLSPAEVDAEIKRVELETALLNLEAAKDENARIKADKAVRSLQNRQRQQQLKTDHIEKKKVIETCTHRQGGSPGRERKGSGPSALRVVILPDNRELIMCANCPLRIFSPLPSEKAPRVRRGETEAARDVRVAKYQADLKEFERLKEQSQDQLTPEAAAPMHCGKTFQFEDGNGNQVSMPAPCDSYAQGLDNRQVA